MANPEDRGLSRNERIVREAKERFQRCETWEAVARKRWIEDIKFANADSDNMYQWPGGISTARGYGTPDERPCLTINKTQQHCFQIINDARQNKSSVKFRPVGNGASYHAAQLYEGLMRHIEYVSNAQSAYAAASRFQVQGGIGYIRVATDYAGDDTLDQEIFIRKVKDPLTIYLDPDYSESDGSDARFAFVFDDMPRDEFNRRYPQYKDGAIDSLGAGTSDGWFSDDHVRVAEYFRRVEIADTLHVFADGRTLRASDIPPELRKTFPVDNPGVKSRDLNRSEVEWFLIIGNEVAETRDWPGETIPIIPVPGITTVIDGELDRKGHVRALKDPQRMYNYNASAQVEFGALQSKIPFIGPAQAIEGNEAQWSQANTQNFSILTYNHRDDDGQEIPAPERAEPPNVAPAYEIGMRNAENDMMLVSGQYQAEMGAPSNERSGKAINARQRQGENATYHFIDHLAMAQRRIGKIILDLVPKIYDTRRLVKIMAEDGTDTDITIDPDAQAAYQKTANDNQQAAEQIVMNPNIGRYDVMSDVGPDYATRRQEAFNALTQIITSDPAIMPIVGDLLFKAADFPYSEEVAERLERMVPAQAKGTGPSREVQELQAQLQNMSQLLAEMGNKLADQGVQSKSKDAENDTKVYEAVTRRLDVILSHLGISATDAAQMDHDIAMETHKGGIEMAKAEQAADLAPEPQAA